MRPLNNQECHRKEQPGPFEKRPTGSLKKKEKKTNKQTNRTRSLQKINQDPRFEKYTAERYRPN